MSDTSRRKFLAATGATAAVGGASIVGGTGAAAAARPHPARAKERVVALVDGADAQSVTLLVGEDEVVVHDRDLATRILNAAGGN